MITFRCTAKLARRFNFTLDAPSDSAPDNLLGDWYANLLNVGSERWVLCVSERSYLPIILPARKAEFPTQFGIVLMQVLEMLGVPAENASREAQLSSDFRYGKTTDRSVLGTLTEMAYHADHELRRYRDPIVAATALSEMPCRLRDTIFPDQAVFVALGIPELYDRNWRKRVRRIVEGDRQIVHLPHWLAN